MYTHTHTHTHTNTHTHTHTHTHTRTHTHTHTGQSGWGIAWYINKMLIPELVVRRGSTYTFIIYGGDDPSKTADYHPFYITSSISGGRLLNSEEQKRVRYILAGLIFVHCYLCQLWLSISVTRRGPDYSLKTMQTHIECCQKKFVSLKNPYYMYSTSDTRETHIQSIYMCSLLCTYMCMFTYSMLHSGCTLCNKTCIAVFVLYAVSIFPASKVSM